MFQFQQQDFIFKFQAGPSAALAMLVSCQWSWFWQKDLVESLNLSTTTIAEIIFPLQSVSLTDRVLERVGKDCPKRSLPIKRNNIPINWGTKITSPKIKSFEAFLLTIQLRNCTVKGILWETILFKYPCHFFFLEIKSNHLASNPGLLCILLSTVIKLSCILYLWI